MRTTVRFLVAATISVYLLIFIGGLVRVSGAGLGCPDWPQCFGRWIPPVTVDQLPQNIDPAQFNFTLAWIEYINRLCGVVVGLLVAISMLLTIKHFARVRSVFWPVLGGFLLLLFVAWQGSKVVESELDPAIVSTHMFFAICIANLLTFGALRAYYVLNPGSEAGSHFPGGLKFLLPLTWLLGLVQAILGANLRGALATLERSYPLAEEAEFLGMLNPVHHIHLGFGFLIFILAVYLAVRILVGGKNLSAVAWQAAWGVLLLASFQVFLGLVMIMGGFPALAELLHLWSAAGLIGTLLILVVARHQATGGQHVA